MPDGQIGAGLPEGAPEVPDAVDRPRVGTDEWVAQVEQRREAGKGLTGAVARGWEHLPAWGRLAVLLGPFAVFPFITNEGNLYRYGLITLIYAVLALGLNIVVGFAGLLDLGYIAFFGFGAYLYGIIASGHSGHHLQAEIAVPIVVVSTALLGLLLGLTSWRLLGDYLAIVTLFFLQAFVIVGGLGSIGGVVIGALVVNGAPELLRSSANARFLFYGVLVLALLVGMKPWYRAVVVLLGTISFGFAVHAIVGAVWSRGTAGHTEGGGAFGRVLDHWVLLPTHADRIGGWAYFALIVAALVLTLVRG